MRRVDPVYYGEFPGVRCWAPLAPVSLSSPAPHVLCMSQPWRPARPGKESGKGERERTEGDANPWHRGSTLSYSNKPNTPVYRKGRKLHFCIKGHSAEHLSYTHINTQSGIFQHPPPPPPPFPPPPPLPKKTRLTQACTQGSFRGITVC